jgi:hypothetical protein
VPESLSQAVGWIYRASDAVSDGLLDYRYRTVTSLEDKSSDLHQGWAVYRQQPTRSHLAAFAIAEY